MHAEESADDDSALSFSTASLRPHDTAAEMAKTIKIDLYTFISFCEYGRKFMNFHEKTENIGYKENIC